MKRKWFKNKTYGYGWTPASREGWLVVGVYLAVYVMSGLLFSAIIQRNAQSVGIVWLFLGWIALITTTLLGIAYKTGERPEWRWGKKPNTKKK